MGIVNERIKERRLQLGYTLLYVAENLGVQEATVQRYESGNIKTLKYETITSLAKILKCDPAYLMGWENNPSRLTSPDLTYDETRYLQLYRALDDHGKEMVDFTLQKEWERSTAVEYHSSKTQEDYLFPDAAHERTDISIAQEDIQNDDDIMNADDF